MSMSSLPTNLPSWLGIVIVAAIVISELAFCAVPAWLWAFVGRQKLTEAFAWRQVSGRQYLGAVLLALGSAAAAQVLIVLQNHVWPRGMAGQEANNALLLPLVQQHPLLMALAVPLSAAFSEELLFRGVLQRALVKRMPAWIAIGLASVLFSAVHLDLQGFIVRLLLGALLGVLVLRSGSIFPSMLTHFLYDTALLGGTAWSVHQMGLKAVLRVAGRADSGMSVTELSCYGGAGVLLIGLGWLLCASGWRRRPGETAATEAAAA